MDLWTPERFKLPLNCNEPKNGKKLFKWHDLVLQPANPPDLPTSPFWWPQCVDPRPATLHGGGANGLTGKGG